MYRVAILLAILCMAVALLPGCDDDAFYGGFYAGCPINVPFPDDYDGGDSFGPSDDSGDQGGDTGGDGDGSDSGDGDGNGDGSSGDGDGDDDGSEGSGDGTPANGRQCEVNEFTVCHYPGPNEGFTICVGNEKALEAHLGHGDEEGACEEF